ncbi:uncharacterized protein LOC109934300 [Rhincodon typus]|uniref:uncharacterized protein LOC109934300 n=1 Tax=Rhincodon typus TaxID=259920 RepID=UPI002030B582|nr:uncharacterized protein LOC109934300 [Rhincodon typus]
MFEFFPFHCQDIPVGGIDGWFKLEPRSSSSRVQGDCHLILTLIMSQRDTELCKMMCGMRIHELLLRQLLEMEHSDFQDDQNIWSGKLSKHAVTILAHHAMQLDLSPLQKTAVEWQAYSKHYQFRFMDCGFLLHLLEDLDQRFETSILTKDQEEFLGDSFDLFIDYSWELLQRMKQVFPVNHPMALQQLELMLRCLLKIYSMEAFKVVCPLHDQLHVEIVAMVKKSTSEWYKKMCDTFKPKLKSELTKLMRLVQLVDAVCTELRKDRNKYNQIFVSILKIDYFSIAYQQLEKLVADDVLMLMDELGTTMEQERSQMTQQMGETLFELYLSLKELKQFKEYLQLKDSQLLALTNFHNWFQTSINKWLQIVYEKSCERITRAVSVDQFEPVDTLSKHSSSAVDVVTCFTQIKSFWLQLAWPDPMGAFVFVTKITDMLTDLSVDGGSTELLLEDPTQNPFYALAILNTSSWCSVLRDTDSSTEEGEVDSNQDLKPENILLSEDMHIRITDFGTAKVLSSESTQARANSFVGTAQYVSPELLTEKSACKSSDLWALGCIIYQLVAGLPPFRAGNEYLIFQKIIKLEYEFPEKFFPKAKDLVQQLLVFEHTKRLGCEEMGGYGLLKAHPFFEPVAWENLHLQIPPKLTAYLPAMSEDDEECYGNYDDLLSQFGCMQVAPSSSSHSLSTPEPSPPQRSGSNIEQYIHDLNDNSFELDLQFTDEDKRLLLEKQANRNPWHQFVENNLILKMGPVDKRKGLFARRRQLLLTEGPHLYYVDPVNKVLKGEIPWSQELRPEAKNFKTFFVHTPNRTYYLMDPSGNAHKWCKKIQEVWRRRYQNQQNAGI